MYKLTWWSCRGKIYTRMPAQASNMYGHYAIYNGDRGEKKRTHWNGTYSLLRFV